MKHFPLIVLALALAIPAVAQDNNTITNPVADTNAPAVAGLPASAATLTAPLVLTNGYLCLTNDGMADVTSGGKAVFSFSVTNAGSFVIEAVAHGPDDNSNSYFVNMDAMPADDMIWDVEVTDGFEKHLLNWRGSGDATSDEFSPKVFKLEPGKHQLILVGREPGTELKSITIRPARNAPANVQSH
jgi:hypothetical protein